MPALGLTQIQSSPRVAGSVPLRLGRDPKAARMQRVDQRRVELEHRLAAGDHHQPPVRAVAP